MAQKTSTFEVRRSRAHFVGQIDTCCLVFVTLTIIAIFPLGMVALCKQYHHISGGVLVYLVYSALILLAFLAVEYYATSRLVKASSNDDGISPEKCLSWCHIWFPLNVFFLVVGILILLLVYQPKMIMALIIGVTIRVYMLRIVKDYMNALEERVSENRPHTDYRLHEIFGSLNINEFQNEMI